MTKEQVYEVLANGVDYRQLSFESDWQAASPFMYGKSLNEVSDLSFRYRTLEEDLADEEELMEDDDGGDPDQARRRFEAGVGDCAYALGFVTTLIFSSRAQEVLAETLNATGQVFPVQVDRDTIFVFNCTRLIDAVDTESSEIRFVGDRRPSQFSRLGFKENAILGETLFKVQWPQPKEPTDGVDYTKIPPLSSIFCTQKFVEMVSDSGLTGFRFKCVTSEVT